MVLKKPTYKELERRIHDLENELKQKTLTLEESEDRYRMFFNNLTEAISLHKMIMDEKGHVIDFTYEEVNPAREKLINLKYPELKNKTVREVNPDIEDNFIEKYGDIAITGKPLFFEYNSKTFNKHLKVKAFSPKYGYVATIIEDVTDQKRAEELLIRTSEKYRTIFENSIEGIVLIDDTGTIIEWNKCIENITGYTKSDAVGKKLWDIQFSLLTEDWKSEYPEGTLQKIWLNLIENLPDDEIFKAEGQFLDKEGKLVLTEDIICPVSLKEGRFLCIIQLDLTERRNAEQELKVSEQKLKQLNATKDKLFSVIAHDLRSPFNSILGYSQYLKENIRKFSFEESEKYLDIINSSAQNTLNLLINLLSWAKHQTDQTLFNPEMLNLRQILDEVGELQNLSAKIKNITINIKVPDRIKLYADKNMLKTILQNLISNSIKFTKTGGTIQISARPFSDYLEITVSDNGIGMSRQTIGNLFKIETNVPRTGTFNEAGTGLGLIICREFVEKHGGKIWTKSKVGKGSDFKITFPSISDGRG